MSGSFGVASKESCVLDVFFGVDYHSHLGTRHGGMVIHEEKDFTRAIHNIENSPFCTKFKKGIGEFDGNPGIGCISDNETQPLLVKSHPGSFAITTVGHINNLEELQGLCFKRGVTHFLETSTGEVNPIKPIASLINHETTIAEDLQYVQSLVKGSMNTLLMTQCGIYVARDLLGRAPIVFEEKETGFCTTSENGVFLSPGHHHYRDLRTGETVFITLERIEVLQKPRERTKICSFLWVHYGYPTSAYGEVSVECMRNHCGELPAGRGNVEVDSVADIPDSGAAHAVGYSNVSNVPFARPFTKYAPTWPRPFIPTGQIQRNMIAKVKLTSTRELIQDKRLPLMDDSTVRGTQLRGITGFPYESGTKGVHARPACPPIIPGCRYPNFPRSKLEMDLITCRVIRKLGGDDVSSEVLAKYVGPDSEHYQKVCEEIRQRFNFTSPRYHRLDDMITSIGLDKCKLCIYCRDGKEDDEEQGKEASFAF